MERVTVPVPGGTLEGIAAGDRGGPLAVCVHGFPDSRETFAVGGMLDRLAGAGHRAVAPSLRGYAPSTLTGPHDADRLAEDVLAVADALSPDRPVALVGHDWGAVATYVAVSRYPTRFRAAVTLAVPHPLAFFANLGRAPTQIRRSAYMAAFQLPGLPEARVVRDPVGFVRRIWARWSPGLTLPMPHVEHVAARIVASLPGPFAHYRAMTRPPAAAVRRLREAATPARRIRVPTLHLHGVDDGCIAPALRSGQGRFFVPGALAQGVVEGVGHFLHLERPEEVHERIVAWIAPR